MNWYLDVLKKYAEFTGRARRKEYWMFQLFYILIMIAISIVESIIGLPFVISGLYLLAMIVPSLAVMVRRLHDTGRSGWWFFISFVPLVGGIILLVFLCLDSEAGDNEYGTNPKAGE